MNNELNTINLPEEEIAIHIATHIESGNL